jgi:pimeloyl-ACP methyl ester carboxylesterase
MKTNEHTLPDVLSGQRRELEDSSAGRISYASDGPQDADSANEEALLPLLLIHSINASASAHEIKPIYDAFKGSHRVYAMDLPGFGHSERSDRPYLQPLMVDAILAMVEAIRAETGARQVDVLAVSLSCEFLAKAALLAPDRIRSLALVSPTGFARNTPRKGRPEESIGKDWVLGLLKGTRMGNALFRLLASERSIRFFLRKTWGRKEIDEDMFRTSVLMARHPDAAYAPFHFISGFLFSAGIPDVFRKLRLPVWLSHGVRGDFNDFSRTDGITEQDNWTTSRYETGALPYFEVTEPFIWDLRTFLDRADSCKKENPPER